MNTIESTSPSIYVACLASYNSSILHGEWFELDEFADGADLQEAINEQVIKTSPVPFAEEWAIHDYENFEGYKVSEWEDFDTLIEIASAIDEFGGSISAWLENGEEWDENKFKDEFIGIYDSEEAFGEEMLEGSPDYENTPESMQMYIDVTSYTRDLMINSYWSAEVQVFNGFSNITQYAIFIRS